MQTAETLFAIYDRVTGEPDDAKVSRPVRGGAVGKGRIRLPVTAVASRAHEPRSKTYLASRLPYEEAIVTRKPFVGTLRGIDPRPAELGQRPEASLAWCRGDPGCEA